MFNFTHLMLASAACAASIASATPAYAQQFDYWRGVSGCASSLSASSSSYYSVGCDSTANKSMWKSTASGGWTALPSSGVEISAGRDDSLWHRKANGAIHRWTGSAWSSELTIGSGFACASRIAAATGSTLYTLDCSTNTNKGVWRWNGSSWTAITGKTGVQIAHTPQGLFVLDSNRVIWRQNGSSWVSLPSSTDRLGNGSDRLLARGINNGTLYEWNGSTWTSIVSGTVTPLGFASKTAGDYLAYNNNAPNNNLMIPAHIE